MKEYKNTLAEGTNAVRERNEIALQLLCALVSHIDTFDYARNDANGHTSAQIVDAAYKLTDVYIAKRNS